MPILNGDESNIEKNYDNIIEYYLGTTNEKTIKEYQ